MQKPQLINRVLYFCLTGIVYCLQIFGSGCEKKANEPVLEMIDGVEVIHNNEIPLHPNKTIQFIEDLTIGAEDETSDIHLFQPGPFMVDANENIYISDRSDQTIKKFDINGIYIKTIGAKGKGPGEFLSIGSMDFLSDGRLVVLDYRGRRVSIFNTNGEYLNSINLQNSILFIYLTTDSSFTCDERRYGESRQLIKTLNFSGKEILSLGEFILPSPKLLTLKGVTYAISTPYSPCSIFAGDNKRQWLYHCKTDKYLIEVYNQNGKLFRKIDRPYEAVPFTSKDREKYLANFEKNPNKIFVQMAQEVEFPEVKTIAERLLVDELGNLWVTTNEEKEENGQSFVAYDIFNKDGFYDTRIWSDVHPRFFVRGKMYSRVTDKESGFTTIKRFQVKWSG